MEKKFGLCDDDSDKPAYSATESEDQWIATVINKIENVVFTPIDKCIIFEKDGSKDRESTCDGMLTFGDSLFLVELKSKRKNWFTEGIAQIENTISLMRKHDAISRKYLKAYVCNKKHPNFTKIEHSFKKRFYDKTGFRIDNQAVIQIR
ncbi:MAG: hypothetical protein ABR574_05465 [Cryomorphaceae bacterium]|nr:hypothetical protein [Flavobacteriales bacterium]